MDFLFEYYAFRPARLRRWSPGPNVLLKGAVPDDAPDPPHLEFSEDGAFIPFPEFPGKRISSFQWITQLLANSLGRPPQLGCNGMHEWAMVYRAENVRHPYLQLRLPMEKIAEVVEQNPPICTHFEAFRFFTDKARPLNRWELSRDTMLDFEQPGCLHTNMDLYKWAFKIYPWIDSQLIWDAFTLALEARTMDMQASPYDMREYGLQPIAIETTQGRREYQQKQKDIYEKSQPVRKRLLSAYQYLLKKSSAGSVLPSDG